MKTSDWKIWNSVSLRTRIHFLLTLLVVITVIGGIIMIWYTYRMDSLLHQIVEKKWAAFEQAGALEIALVNQKGFVSYYFLDGDPDWLKQLGEYREIFQERFGKALELAETETQKTALRNIEAEYSRYISLKNQVIAHYKSGRREMGARLHQEVRDRFFKILDLCENYKSLQREWIQHVHRDSRSQARNLRFIAVSAVMAVLCLALLLGLVLFRQILGPLRRLAIETTRDRTMLSRMSRDEVKTLSRSVRGLIKDADHTQHELERSRETLLQAEKLALVGKLAAGTAHSIRNPLTSVKMRLFSLSRSLDMKDPQKKEDFDVISNEIRHIDTIVENFLEFSRPPKLKMQTVDPGEIVDGAVQLLRHRLDSYNVDIQIMRVDSLVSIQADPEQLKEVLVNLVVNACEAMETGGHIEIRQEIRFLDPTGAFVQIRLTDDGPGIPESIQERIFEPFFTTKEEGTGLGLSIACRIVEQHGGTLAVESTEGQGTTFIINLPLKEKPLEHDSDR